MKAFLVILALISLIQIADACDMFAAIALNDSTLAMQDTVIDKFNDLIDFFDFIKMRSDMFIQDDGYGCIYYNHNNYQIDSTQAWYKTGYNVWYGDGKAEPLDNAISTILNPVNDAAICMTHARNGTAANGSHPFLFDYNGRTYSFMHNGAINRTLKRAIMNFLGEEWFNAHPSNWYGVYPDENSFIDSELLFHYLMWYIIDRNDVVTGITAALNNTNLDGINFSQQLKEVRFIFNFVFPDGEHLFAFRNSSQNYAVYNLSYSLIANRFYAIKPGESLTKNDMQTMTLVKLSPSENPTIYDIDETLPVILNDFTASYLNDFVKIIWSTYSETDISGWNLYQNKVSSDFYSHHTNKVNFSLINATGDNSNYEFKDDSGFGSGETIYYWIEAMQNSGEEELFNPIKINISEDEPNIDEMQTLLYGNFPNPFNDKSKINFLVKDNAILQIYNIKGQLVYSQTYNSGKHSFYTPDFPNGIYFYRLKSSSYDVIKKMIKIK